MTEELKDLAKFYEHQIASMAATPSQSVATKSLAAAMQIAGDNDVNPFDWASMALHMAMKIYFANWQQDALNKIIQTYYALFNIEQSIKDQPKVQ